MLELRPTCEHCDKPLPPASTEAMICSMSRLFMRVLPRLRSAPARRLPNCGGGFVPWPIRPAHEWRTGVFLGHQPAGERRVFKPVDLPAHDFFAARLRELPPERR